MDRNSVWRLMIVIPLSLLLGSCFHEDNPELGDIFGVASENQCGYRAIPKPIVASAKSIPNLLEGCLSYSIEDIADYIDRSTSELGDIDADILFNEACLELDKKPKNLTFLVGTALRKAELGDELFPDFRVPIPGEINFDSLVDLADDVGDALDDIGDLLAPGKQKNQSRAISADGLSINIPTGTSLLVGKLIEFRGERRMQLVNIASVKDVSGQQFIETLSDVAKQGMSNALGEIMGPGIYAVYLSEDPVGFISGTITLDDEVNGDTLVISTEGPFVSFSNENGQYTVASTGDRAGLAAFELNSGANAEIFIPLNGVTAINPKTNQAPLTPASENALDGLDNLNLTGVDIQLVGHAFEDRESVNANLDFEQGDLVAWTSKGNVTASGDDFSRLFPQSTENYYAFLSTGVGAVSGAVSGIVRDVTVPTNVSRVYVEYNVLTQEYPDWVDTIYNDSFFMLIAGRPDFLHYETVNNNEGEWLDFYQAVGNVSDSVNVNNSVVGVFGGETGTRQVSYDISDCAGSDMRMVFGVSDIGDTIYDTAAVINRVWFE